MSNKNKIQENNLKIQENNNDLNSILNTINNLPINNGIDTSDATVVAQDIVKGKVAYARGEKIVGILENAKITNASYLFYQGIRTDYLNEILALCEGVTNTKDMFTSCTELTSLDLSNFDTSNVTNMNNMFFGCSNLTSLDLSNFNTSKVTDMGSMFMHCKLLETLDLSSFDMGNVIAANNMFNSMTGLVNLKFAKNYGKAFKERQAGYYYYILNFSNCNNLTHDSLMSIINNLYDLNLTISATGNKLYTQTLQLGSTNKAKLTEEEILIATNKGWTVS